MVTCRENPLPKGAGAGALWTAMEFARGAWPLGGFTWGGVAYTQANDRFLLPLASITGALGVTFVVNDDVEAATALRADGVHLGQGDEGGAKARLLGLLLGRSAATVEEAVDRVFWSALGRGPSADERAVAEPALRDSRRPERVSAEGLADLLWAVLMKPEFQLIY